MRGKLTIQKRSFIIFFLVLILFFNPIFGWSTKTHQKIAKEALYSLPKEYQRKLSPYLDELLEGSVAPDRIYKDFNNHVFHVHVDKGKGPEKVREKYLEIISLVQEGKPWRLIAFQLGVLSHYIADLNNPLHTDSSKREDEFHSKYEKDADVINPKIKSELIYIKYPASYILDSIFNANRFYKDIEKAYLSGDKFRDVSKITQEQIDKAALDTASYFYSALTRGSRGTSLMDLICDLIDHFLYLVKVSLRI